MRKTKFPTDFFVQWERQNFRRICSTTLDRTHVSAKTSKRKEALWTNASTKYTQRVRCRNKEVVMYQAISQSMHNARTFSYGIKKRVQTMNTMVLGWILTTATTGLVSLVLVYISHDDGNVSLLVALLSWLHALSHDFVGQLLWRPIFLVCLRD